MFVSCPRPFCSGGVIQPFPSEPVWPRWTIPLYLFFGMMPGGALGAFLCFSDRVLYPAYAAAPNLFGMTPLEDQVFAGALMWVVGTFVYLIHTIVITMQLLSVRGQYCPGQERTTLRDVIAAPPDEDPSDARGAAIQGTLKAVSR
jgi:cytochrome c oxidase assembly factor CtaG